MEEPKTEIEKEAQLDPVAQNAKSSVEIKETTRGPTIKVKVVTGEEKVIDGLTNAALKSFLSALGEKPQSVRIRPLERPFSVPPPASNSVFQNLITNPCRCSSEESAKLQPEASWTLLPDFPESACRLHPFWAIVIEPLQGCAQEPGLC